MNQIIIGILAILLSSCGNTCMLGMGDCEQEYVSSVLALTPSTTTVAVSGTVTLTASGGTSPYTFTKLTGNGTSENGSDGLTVVYTAPTSSELACFRVTDNTGATDDVCFNVDS